MKLTLEFAHHHQLKLLARLLLVERLRLQRHRLLWSWWVRPRTSSRTFNICYSVCLRNPLSARLYSVHIFVLKILLTFHSSDGSSVSLSIHLSICRVRRSVRRSLHLFYDLYACLSSICLFVQLSVRLSVYPFVCLRGNKSLNQSVEGRISAIILQTLHNTTCVDTGNPNVLL